MKQFETVKLHYGQYLYKVVLNNSLAAIFRSSFQRNGHLGFARQRLDEFENMLTEHQTIHVSYFRTIREIDIGHFFDAKKIYKILVRHDNYKIRVESSYLTVYTNDEKLVNSLSFNIGKKTVEIWKPNTKKVDLLLENKNIILVNRPTAFPIKITLGNKNGSSTLGKWLQNNPDKCSYTDSLLSLLLTESFVENKYFYLKNEQVLLLIEMIAGTNIRRVEKLVYTADLDK